MTIRLNMLSLGSMRCLVAIAGLLLALLFAAAPAEAASMAGSDTSIAASASQDGSDVTVSASAGHCPHVPCPDSSHEHVPGGCVGHSFVADTALQMPRIALSDGRVAFEHEDASGRTLLPPVPPPLA